MRSWRFPIGEKPGFSKRPSFRDQVFSLVAFVIFHYRKQPSWTCHCGYTGIHPYCRKGRLPPPKKKPAQKNLVVYIWCPHHSCSSSQLLFWSQKRTFFVAFKVQSIFGIIWKAPGVVPGASWLEVFLSWKRIEDRHYKGNVYKWALFFFCWWCFWLFPWNFIANIFVF